MSEIKTWVIRFLDVGTSTLAKADREFIGTEEQLQTYIESTFGTNNYLLGRYTIYFEKESENG